MKIKIRQGVFETNSSSEHNVSVVRESDWNGWVSGKLVAAKEEESTGCESCWGNFWSELDGWKFTEPSQRTSEENNKIIRTWIEKEISNINEWCKSPDYDQKDNKYWENRLNELSAWWENPDRMDNYTKFIIGCWITFEEYVNGLENGDCYSPFHHSVPDLDVHVFGTYFHS